jgi:hypothetical protein
MWPQHRWRSSPFRDCWAVFCSYIGQMFDKTRDQMSNWRWDNPCTFGDEVNGSNPQTTSLRRVKRTGERFSWYRSDDLRATLEPTCCRHFKPGDFLAEVQGGIREMKREIIRTRGKRSISGTAFIASGECIPARTA